MCSPWCWTQGPALGKVVTAGSLCGVRCICHIWTFWRSVRGRIYSRAKSTHCTLQIEMKSGSKLLPLMALSPEWIGDEPWPPTPAWPLGLGMTKQQRACALTGLKRLGAAANCSSLQLIVLFTFKTAALQTLPFCVWGTKCRAAAVHWNVRVPLLTL